MLSVLLHRVYARVREQVRPLDGEWPAVTLFLSLTDTRTRARVLHASGSGFESVWVELVGRARKLVDKEKLDVRWLRVDWVTDVRAVSMGQFQESLRLVKRNYFRYGLALDPGFRIAFLEAELNANAMLYTGSDVAHAQLNRKNFQIYAQTRFGKSGMDLDFADAAPVWVLETAGAFCSGDGEAHLLYGSGPDAGRRVLEPLDVDTLTALVRDGSSYLASQVRSDGRFHYGWHPCFDRPIPTYNTLRHASTLYAMLESWEVTREPALEAAIRRGLDYLCAELIKPVRLADGTEAAFLVDIGNEIKLGGNAVCLLALCKHAELFPGESRLQLLEQLALGIRHMHDSETGAFVHVLNYPDLGVKETFRVIYYDGEAAFGLMRLYELTGDSRWLELVESAFRYFLEKEHWKTHDHWLGYCVSALTKYRPEARYFEFGIRNVADYLDFVQNRITTFPTLLELMTATEQLLVRLRQEPEHCHLLQLLDEPAFYRAMERRARHMLNGHFWPELAMYYRNPARIVGSFFIRHHAFRVRIDDVEHYLSGFVAYRRYLLQQVGTSRALSV